MIAPEVQPVYLAVPSRGLGSFESDAAIEGFVDALAVHPAAAERVVLGVVEYSTFVNELFSLGGRMEDAARVTVSGFSGTSYASSFEDLARLLEYDRYRLSGQGVRGGRPLIAMILDAAPQPGDQWEDGHRVLVESTFGSPVIVAVTTDATALSFADLVAYPTQLRAVATNSTQAGEVAAAIVIRTIALRGINELSESVDRDFDEEMFR